MGNLVTKICQECNEEFQISKFQPYIVHCKKHRKGKKPVKTGKSKLKAIKKEMKSHGFKCSHCEEIYNRRKMGLFICKYCKSQFWVIQEGWYRTWSPPYRIFFEGEFVGELDTLLDLRMMMEGYNGR